MKEILKKILGGLTKLLGPRVTGALVRAVTRSMGAKDFEQAFGFPQEVVQVTPGHYYSVIPDVVMARKRSEDLFGAPRNGIQGVDQRISQQYALAEKLGPLFADFPYSFDAHSQSVKGEIDGRPARYESSEKNQTFHLDAVVLQAMLRHFQPKKVIEVGSGYSSAMMLDTRERYGWADQELTFIEPYSQDYFFPLLRDDDRNHIRLIEEPLWDVAEDVFRELQSGDLLFIDSSHVAKLGSDVYHYLFNILPLLQSGVVIHIHDIPTWFEMAPLWFERGWYWNEGQFLRAFLMYNTEFEILFHSSAMCWQHPQAPGMSELRAHLDETFKLPATGWTNSFYMRRK
jgi:predicted O-methyltransferase YrrM